MSRFLIAVAILGSVALLGGALAFQYLGGLAPCQMCIWQRWPHAIAIVLGLIAFVPPARKPATRLAGLVVLIGAGIAVFHAGVEWNWWEGLTACTGTGDMLGGLGAEDLLSTDGPLGVVRCDEAAWVFLGLSMAGWNAIFSLLLSGVWIAASNSDD